MFVLLLKSLCVLTAAQVRHPRFVSAAVSGAGAVLSARLLRRRTRAVVGSYYEAKQNPVTGREGGLNVSHRRRLGDNRLNPE
jgi:hypothetical protein